MKRSGVFIIWLFTLWALIMLSLPILGWSFGEQTRHGGVAVGVLAQLVVVLAVLVQAWGWQRALLVGLVVVMVAWLAEFNGSTTGIPFGKYHYTALLQPQLLGVPLLIPLAWLMMLPPAWSTASFILACARLQGLLRRLAFIALSALAFTAWDFFLDPQMVGWGYWVWEQPGRYFGIPWMNFLGWLLVSAVITALAGRESPQQPLLWVYGTTWVLQSVGQALFFEQPGPAAVGFIVMGIFVFWAFGVSFADLHRRWLRLARSLTGKV